MINYKKKKNKTLTALAPSQYHLQHNLTALAPKHISFTPLFSNLCHLCLVLWYNILNSLEFCVSYTSNFSIVLFTIWNPHVYPLISSEAQNLSNAVFSRSWRLFKRNIIANNRNQFLFRMNLFYLLRTYFM